MSFTLKNEQIQVVVAGHDLRDYRGWIAAALALLADAPDWSAIQEQNCANLIVKLTFDGNPYVCSAPGYAEADHVYTQNDLSDFDHSAWDDQRGCWDGTEIPADDAKTLTSPVFVSLNHS